MSAHVGTEETLLADLRQAARLALPVMLGYVTIGIPCGILESQAGLSWWQALLLSATFYSGAGQFMMSSMALSGASLLSMIASVGLVSSRQVLYSAAFSPYFQDVPKLPSALFAATVTDESFGVNLDAFQAAQTGEARSEDGGWSVRRATAVNLLCLASWAVANGLGCALGPVLDLPVDVMSFAMTAIFICLLMGQRWDATTVVVVAGAAVGVVALKLVGLSSVAVLGGAVVGVAAGLVWGALRGRGDGGGAGAAAAVDGVAGAVAPGEGGSGAVVAGEAAADGEGGEAR